MLPNADADWLIAPSLISPAKNRGNCSRYGSGTMMLADRQVPAVEPQHPVHVALVVGDDGCEEPAQPRALGEFPR